MSYIYQTEEDNLQKACLDGHSEVEVILWEANIWADELYLFVVVVYLEVLMTFETVIHEFSHKIKLRNFFSRACGLLYTHAK